MKNIEKLDVGKGRDMGFEIVATGSYLPKKTVTNFDFEQRMDTSDEWIYSRTGIKERRYVEDETTEDLGFYAAKAVIEKSGVAKEKIRALLVPTFTSDYLTPSVACLLQRRLELPEDLFALDINGACSGFLYGLKIADSLLCTMEEDEYILVVGSEVISKLLNFEDRGTSILFGDGAGAVLVKKRKGNAVFSVGSRGTAKELGCAGVNRQGLKPQVYMDGKEVFRFATSAVIQCIEDVLKKADISKETPDYIICHQANWRIIDYVRKKLDLPSEKFYGNIERYGNTSSASIPIVLDEMSEKGLLKKGMRVLLVGFGGGLTWGGTLLEW